LCAADYQAARYAIETGKVTEGELIDGGLMLPAHASNATSELRSALADAMKRQRRKKQWNETANSLNSTNGTSSLPASTASLPNV
jgi:hypothetical protein